MEPKQKSFIEITPSLIFGRFSDVLFRKSKATIFLGNSRKMDEPSAWTKIKPAGDINFIKLVRNEAMIMSSIRNDFILQIFCYFECDSNLNTIVELLPELNQSIKYFLKNDSLKISKRLMIKQIVEGLNFLHQRKPIIVHGNIKPSNILFDPVAQQIKIANFMYAQLFEGELLQTNNVAITKYSSPEFLNGFYDQMTDVYSLGMTIIYITTNLEPFYNCNLVIDNKTKGFRLPVEHIAKIDDFLLRMLVRDMTKYVFGFRPKFNEILLEACFRDLNVKSVNDCNIIFIPNNDLEMKSEFREIKPIGQRPITGEDFFNYSEFELSKSREIFFECDLKKNTSYSWLGEPNQSLLSYRKKVCQNEQKKRFMKKFYSDKPKV